MHLWRNVIMDLERDIDRFKGKKVAGLRPGVWLPKDTIILYL